MKHVAFLLIIFTLTLLSCKHESENPVDCLDQFIADAGMVKYTGQTLGCSNDYLLHMELDGKSYFQVDNPCADMLSIPVDCDHVPYFQQTNPSEVPAAEWQYFFQNAINKGIIAVKI
jgi:hypothetical protein